jgi:hypothetical protein
LCGDRLLVVRHGRLLGVIISPADYDRLDQPAAAAPPHDADELWEMLRQSTAARRLCAKCGGGLAQA